MTMTPDAIPARHHLVTENSFRRHQLRKSGKALRLGTAIILILSSFGQASFAVADDAATPAPVQIVDNRDAYRLAYTPQLSFDDDTAICRPFQAAVTRAFLSYEPTMIPLDRDWPGQEAQTLLPAQDLVALEQTDVQQTEIDLDHTGRPNQIEYGAAFTGQGNWATVDFTVDGKSLVGMSINENENPVTGAPGLPALIEIDGQAYLMGALSDRGGILDSQARHVALFRLTPKKHDLQQVCSVEVFPSDDEATLAAGQFPQFSSLVDVLKQISGDEGDCAGSMHAQSAILASAAEAAAQVHMRPWAGAGVGGYNSYSEVMQALDDWQYLSLYNFQLYRRLLETRPKAQAELAGYLATVIGQQPAAASTDIAQTLDTLTTSYFVFRHKPVQPTLSDTAADQMKLQRQLLSGASAAEISDTLIAMDLSQAPDFSRPYPQIAYLDSMLVYALERPALMQVLIDHRADPNATNGIGKTALMYAAQYDLIDSAKLLLANGAKVNLASTMPSNCSDYAIRAGGRTALTYALSRGSEQMINLLIEHGADTGVVDSAKKSALDYLKLNQSLTPVERHRITALLAGAPKPAATP